MKLSKRIIPVLAALWLLISGTANAQTAKWQNMGNNKNATFYQVQQDFYQYWEGKKIEKGKGYKPFKRWEAFMAPRVYPSGDMSLPSTTYANFLAWKQSNALLRPAPGGANSTLSTGNWTEIGPIGSPSGPLPYTRTGAGRLSFVRFDPTNNNTMYVGAPDGGLWKSTNSGTTWTTNTDFLTIIGCSDLCIDPTNTQIMYLSTGDIESDRNTIGILKSTNGGATWNTTGLTFAPSDYYRISKLLMNPSNSLNMIAATNGGIYRTTDGWVTSTQVQCCNDFKDMEFKPGDPNTVYAAGDQIFKSTDNGVTWAQITAGLPSSSSVSRIALGVTTGNSSYVYALIGNSSSGFLGMYRSTDNGTTFSLRASTPNLLGYQADGSDNGGQASYDLAVAVSPTNPDIVTTGGINHWQSMDGGTTWTNLSFWASGEVHADIHEISYLPGSSTTMFSCNDGGIFKSTDNGDNFTDISNNLAIAQVVGFGNSANVATTMVNGEQDNGTNLKTGSSWNNIFGGDGGECFFDYTNNNTIYYQYVNGAFKRSTDGGVTTTSITTGLPPGPSFDFYSAWVMDPVNPNRLYVGGVATLYTSPDQGTTWTALGTPPGVSNIKGIAVAPSNTTIIYVIKDGAVSKSTNSGVSFADITGTLPVANASLTSVAVSNTDPNKVWVTFSGYSAGNKVFKSIDGGTSWTNVSTGLPNLPMNEVVYTNGSATDAVYIGSDIGVYYLDNTLASCAPFMTNLPNVAVKDLEIYYPTGKIRAGTYGRGMWESDLNTTVVNFTITASAGANGSISPSGAVTVASGANQTFTITPNTCYQIATVLVDGVNNPAAVSSGTFTFTNVTAAHTISATFSQLTYNITASAGVNGSISPNGVTSVNCGANQTYTITANSCYIIADVIVDGVSQGAIGTYTFTNVTAAHTISATFTQLSYNITASAGANGSITPNGVTSVNCGANQTYTITPNGGFNVQDVLVDGVSQGAITTYTFTNVTATHTISATFVSGAFTITASAGPNGSISPSGAVSVTSGANQTFTITANSCYSIADVLIDGVSQGALGTYTFTNVTAAHTISATFSQLSYNITASAGANGSITPNGVTSVNCGASQAYTFAANACYQVATVLIDGVNDPVAVSSGTYTFSNVTAAHTISVTFSQLTYNITSSAGANGSISPNGVTTVNCGDNQTYNITADGGYDIQNVVVDGLSQGAIPTYTFNNVTATHTISASFVLTGGGCAVTGSGTTTPVLCFGNSNGTATITLTGAGSGAPGTYTVDGGGSQPYTSNPFTITGLTAGNHTVIATVTAGSCVSPNIPVNVGTPATFTATYVKTNLSACNVTPDGSITVTSAGGTAPYTYVWSGETGSNHTPFTAGNVSSLTGLNYGYYNVTITDANNCGVVTYSNIHVQFAYNVYVTSSGSISSSCGNTGSISLYGNAGILPYTYSLDGTTYVSANTFTGLAAGTYTGYVKDAGGCVSTKPNINIGAAAAITVSPFARAASSCANDGSIEIYRSGGIPPYTYSKDNITYQASNVFSGLAAGPYTVYVKDSKNCVGQQTTTVAQGAALNVTTSKINTSVCMNDGTIQVYVSGGVAPFTYSKDGGTTFQTGNSFNGLGAGNYSIVVKDAKNCLGSTNVNIALNTIVVTASTTASTTCISNNGKIQLFRTGGTGPYTYSLDGSTYQSSTIFLNKAPGTYMGYVKDSKTCVGTLAGIVVGPNCLPPPIAGTNAKTNVVNVSREKNFKVEAFPNPSEHEFTLVLDGFNIKEKVSITVTDLLGRKVYQTAGTGKLQYTFGKNFKTGMYNVQVLQGKLSQSLKLVKE